MSGQATLPGIAPVASGRRHLDYYPTPAWCARLLLDEFAPDEADTILEPSCGNGALLKVLRERYPDATLMGVEMDSGRAEQSRAVADAVLCRDFLSWTPLGRVSWVFGNPPFSAAAAFVEHALTLVPFGGHVTFLLRLGFLASISRGHLYAPDAGFYRLDVLGRRPSFTGDGKVDQYDYGWFTWQRGFTGRATIGRLQ